MTQGASAELDVIYCTARWIGTRRRKLSNSIFQTRDTPVMTCHWLHKKKFAVIPDLESPEAIAWSQPLPPEQWATRSPELEEAMREREAQMTERQEAA